jgi:RHS repeat-associated protein
MNSGMRWMRRQGCHALGIVGALLTSPAFAALPETIGRVEGVSEDSSGAVTVQGWACFKGWSWSSPQVDLYAGSRADSGGTRLGTYWTDQPSEPALSEACQTTGRAHRFRITLNISMRQQYAGQRIYIYGHAYPTNGANVLLDSSGQYSIPAAPPARDTLTYIHTDRLGSSVILTDDKANIVAKTNYKAYGGPTQNEQKPEAPGYTGHYEDPLTGLTYMQARYYDADLGVFLSIDPMPTTPGNLFNFGRYGYANANPLSFVDPDGRVAMAAVWLDGYSVSAGGGGGGFFFRPPSNNWWHDIERPNIGDYPGLIGGGGGIRPSKPTDLEAIAVTADPPRILPPFVFRAPRSGPTFRTRWYSPALRKVDDFVSDRIVKKFTFGWGSLGKTGRIFVSPVGFLIWSSTEISDLGGCDNQGKNCADEVLRLPVNGEMRR